MTTSTGRNFLAALILISLTAPLATAQDGIVRLRKSNQPQVPAPGVTHEAEHQAVAEPIATQIVIPPELMVVKRDPDAISIPVEAEPYREMAISSPGVKVNSDFGYRRDPFTRRAKFHSGIDLKARWGDPIGASHAGTILFAGWHRGYGNLIIIDHGGGISTYYAHLSRFELAAGDKVARGTIVGYAGSTGRATSPHLHFEVRLDDQPVNPLQRLALDPSSPFFDQKPEKK